MSHVLYLDDCLERLPTIADDYVDSIVTDPPYEISFMGKEWDGSGIAYDTEMWKEVLRVLKPGGHLLSFGATRTHHRMMVAIEDAGFEIRDCLMWLYGTGFPKNHNISKGIDKQGGKDLSWFIDYILEVAEERGIPKKELTLLFPSKNGKPTGWLYNKKHTQGITLEQYNKIKDFLDLPFETLEEAERQVIGTKRAGIGSGETYAFTESNSDAASEVDITIATTPEAQQWEGWGTALKPAWEPIVMARKPLAEKTIVNNVLKYGTGGINIDECRINPGEVVPGGGSGRVGNFAGKAEGDTPLSDHRQPVHTEGRFPANLILDEEAAVILNEQAPHTGALYSASRTKDTRGGSGHSWTTAGSEEGEDNGYRDAPSGAARFFYCTKPSKAEKSAGLKGPNTHPTIKPLDLMEYLIKLVTPEGGIVLDPFMGSGSTGCASVRQGFNFIGIELEEESFEIAEQRIKHWEK